MSNKAKTLIGTIIIVTVTGLAGCGGSNRFIKPSDLPDDRQQIAEPEVRSYNYIADGFDMQISHQLEQSLDLSRQLRHLIGKPKQSYNVDAFDEVANSSWFTNRNAFRQMSLEEIARGPDTGTGPDSTGYWTVKKAKTEGITPGFHIKDAAGDRYVIKFDPPGYSGLATGAEVVSTKLFYAAGYHTPENYIVFFDQAILKVGDDVMITDKHGKKRLMTEADLEDLLAGVEKDQNGKIRALASKYIPGIPKGPFNYEGTRKDDPNDFIPHQHRRELRGLRVIAAWLNHTDTKSGNSLDSYVAENGINYIRHFLIDFGSTLGSAAYGPQVRVAGHENQIDPYALILNTATLGLYVRPYEKLGEITFPSIGRYEADLFSPGDFKFNTPNPAFENCTNRDGFWGARIVMSFTDEQLRTAVAQGQYSDPEAAAYLFDVLKKRRDATGRFWYGRVNPLDRFEIVTDESGTRNLCFVDLAVEGGLEQGENSEYFYEIRSENNQVIEAAGTGNSTCVPLPASLRRSPGTADIAANQQLVVILKTRRYPEGKTCKWVKAFLSLDEISGNYMLLGIERQE